MLIVSFCIAAFGFMLLALDFVYAPKLITTSSSENRGENGLWLRYLWYFGKHSETETHLIMRRMRESQIKYAYFHIRSTNNDGTLKYKFQDNARKLNATLHAQLPDTKSIAWIYVPSRHGKNRDGVDLRLVTTRKNLIDSAKWLVDECDFDGVQWDYEFFPNGEREFPILLNEARERLGPEVFQSVATPMWYHMTLWGWNEGSFIKIAQRCDQIAVMCYDSFFYYPRAYYWLVEQQCIHVTQAAAKTHGACKVILGIPAYDEGTAGHLTHTENIHTAIAAVNSGLKDKRVVQSAFAGVAPFAEYTMDEDEWKIFNKEWIGQESQAANIGSNRNKGVN